MNRTIDPVSEERGRRLLQWLAAEFNEGKEWGAIKAAAEKLGIASSQLSKYTRGIMEPSQATLDTFREWGLNIGWYMYGTGSMNNPIDMGARKPLHGVVAEQIIPYESEESFKEWLRHEREEIISRSARKTVDMFNEHTIEDVIERTAKRVVDLLVVDERVMTLIAEALRSNG